MTPEQFGPYRIRGELGRGGFGVVFRGEGPGGEVAIKLLERADDEQRRARFMREVAALTELRHPHVVSALDAGEAEGRPYLVLQLVEGETLGERLERTGPLDPDDAVTLLRKLADAVAHSHRRGILHRDIKPDNVLLDRAGEPHLTDFGLAWYADARSLTLSGALLGSPGYWAPEQARGETQLSEAVDVYGLGATLYAALTGGPPVEGSSLVEVVIATEQRAPDPPSELRPEVPAALDAVCLRCLEKKPEDRFPSARALWEALEGWEAAAPGRRWPWLLGAAAVIAAAVAALVGRAPADEGAGLAAAEPAPPSGVSPVETRAPAAPAAPPSDELKRWFAEAKAAIKRGDFAAGERLLDRVLAAAPRHAPALNNRGIAREQQGKLDEAAADFGRVVAIDPESAPGYHNRGRVLRRLGRPREALRDLQRATSLMPNLVNAWYELGETEAALGRHRAAIAAYSRALARRPRHVEALRGRARAYQFLGEGVRAGEDVRLAERLDPRMTTPDLRLLERRPVLKKIAAGIRAARVETVRVAEGDLRTFEEGLRPLGRAAARRAAAHVTGLTVFFVRPSGGRLASETVVAVKCKDASGARDVLAAMGRVYEHRAGLRVVRKEPLRDLSGYCLTFEVAGPRGKLQATVTGAQVGAWAFELSGGGLAPLQQALVMREVERRLR